MKRRTFIITLAGVAFARPLVARAQQRVPLIGVLVQGVPAPAAFLAALREGLREAGYVEGQTIRLEIRSAEGQASRLPAMAQQLVDMNPDVIVGFQTPAITAARAATSRVPIVMAPAGDPMGTGLVASLARPGGNVTGVSGASAEIGAKTVELFRELLPSAQRIGVLASATDPFTGPFVAAIRAGAGNLRMEVDAVPVRPGEPPDEAIRAMAERRADVLIIQGSLARKEVFDLALKHRLPSCSSNQLITTLGGLMAYGAKQETLYRQAVPYIDRILKGANPADLPVEQPTKFELVINMKTAAALGINVPLSLLARADEVIE